MRIQKLGVLVFTILLTLSGCQNQPPSYMDLMTHPELLQNLYNHCVEEVSSPEVPCELITRADADFTSLVDQREKDPEDFGRRILAAEQELPGLKASLDQAWQTYQTTGAQKPSLEVMKSARDQVDKAEDAYKLAQEKIQILLTVVAATSSVS